MGDSRVIEEQRILLDEVSVETGKFELNLGDEGEIGVKREYETEAKIENGAITSTVGIEKKITDYQGSEPAPEPEELWTGSMTNKRKKTKIYFF